MAAIVPALIELFLKSRRGGRVGGGGYGKGGGAPKEPKPKESEEEKSMKYLNLNALKEGIDSDTPKMQGPDSIIRGLLDFDPIGDYDAYMKGDGGPRQ